jgi:16S rRNA (cytosine967-C5)-methyltransferase
MANDSDGGSGQEGTTPTKRTRRNRGRPGAAKRTSGEGRSDPTLSRLMATRILERVERTRAYADITLHQALARSGLGAADRALTTELVYGTLRWRGFLDFHISKALNQELDTLQPFVASSLRLGAYQLLKMDRIPASAAVDQAVRCARATGNARASGLVNAVLRRVAREADELVLPSLDENPVGHLVHALSMPDWIARRMIERYGVDAAADLARASNAAPPLVGRANRKRITREELIPKLTATYPDAVVGTLGVDSIRLGHGGDPGQDPNFRDGLYTIQDEASQLVVELLDPQPDEWILDTCAAPGSKTTAIAERLGEAGGVMALDRNARRLAMVGRASRRLGLTGIFTLKWDATGSLDDLPLPSPMNKRRFDRVLVDAPCSGLGTLRRNPDARWRVQEEDPASLVVIQMNLLSRAAAILSPGGVLVYSTCTFLPEENEGLIQRFLQENKHFQLTPRSELPGHLTPVLNDAGMLECLPHRHDTDGFFAARLERTS